MSRAAGERPPLPDWVDRWCAGSLPPAAALARFDTLAPIPVTDMLGVWHGSGLATGHPLDGLLEHFGWWGKRFRGRDNVDPLLFGRADGGVWAVDAGRVPVALALRLPGLARTGAARRAFAAARPLLQARCPGARLEEATFRGVRSAAMVYLRQPIIDHFRRIDTLRVLGLMTRRGMARPFFFLLVRQLDAHDEGEAVPGPHQTAQIFGTDGSKPAT